MYIVIFSSLLALLLSCLESIGKMRNGMLYGFIMVTILSAIHYNYGNDYMSYYELYFQIVNQPFNWTNIMDGVMYREPGWVILNYVFLYVGGFFMLVAVLSVLQNVFIYRFIKREVEKQWWGLSVFVYLFVTYFYLMSFTMMRQWFVACVFLGLWSHIKKGKWILPLIIIFLCSYVHSSAKILLPFAFYGFLPMRNSKVITLSFVGIIIALWIGGSWINNIFDQTVALSESERYVQVYGDQEIKSTGRGIGFMLTIVPLLVGLHYLLNEDRSKEQKKALVLLSLIGFAINPMNDYFPMIGRLEVYFSIFQIASVPLIYSFIKKVSLQKVLLLLYIIVISYDYINFFSLWKKGFETYHTIFEVISLVSIKFC